MLKENAEMIKEMRNYVMRNIKCNCVDKAVADIAEIILEYDYEESKYNKQKREEEQSGDIIFQMPNLKSFHQEYENLLEKMKNDSNFEKLIKSMTIDVDNVKTKEIR